ncbi:ATPase AAA [Bacteroidia bacterium]|nr:ATPase AAA [Bacteroidia bacterium]
MKNLPIGIQSFEVLRQGDWLYVDKTKIINELVTSGRVYFLSRPRRFGKSLLVSTMEALFQGKKSPFEGLYIYDKWDWTQQNPVIRLDFGGRANASEEELKISLNHFLDVTANENQISLTGETLSDKFMDLIKGLHRSTGRQVVVLIDEYDKPIIDHLSEPEIASAIRTILKNFYQVLKAADEHLRLVFLTGVSKFTKVSIFSELNNLSDITMDARYAAICGYTQSELETCFDDYIERLADKNKLPKADVLEGIRHWYNGYSWDGEISVYNPFSTLLLFDKQSFSNYWFESGTPTFLIDLIKKKNDIQSVSEDITVSESTFMGFDINYIDTVQMLFQTGYLTVKKKIFVPLAPSRYILGLPNEEVKVSMMLYLVSGYTNQHPSQTEIIKVKMQEQINNGDAEGFTQSLRILLANIPSVLHIKRESYYHSLLLAWMKMLGFDIQGEVMTNIGRIDAVWHQPKLTVVAEIKYHAGKDLESLLDDATAQINDRKYYEKFLYTDRVLLMAVAFSGQEIGCRMQLL